jgi:hypothetical protein
MNHQEIVKRYAERTINKKTRDASWKSTNISCKGDIIYSYHWWEMAKYLGKKDNEPLFIKNGDRYSISTAQHQGLVQQYCQGPTISRIAIEAAGINFNSLTQEDILDYT